jgi:sugar lactone lactonase YvrE
MPAPTVLPPLPPNLYSNLPDETRLILASPDGKVLYTAATLGLLRYSSWDARTGKLIRRFGAIKFGNLEGTLSPSGKILANEYGDLDGSRVVLLHSATGKEKLQIKKPTPAGMGFDLNDEVVALPTEDDMRLFSVDTGKIVGKLRHRRRRDYYPKKPRFSSDGKQLLWIGYTNRELEAYADSSAEDELVWFDWKRRKVINAVTFPQTNLYGAWFSGDGKVILVFGFRRYWRKSIVTGKTVATKVRLIALDAQTGKLMYTRLADIHPNDIAVSPDGRWFAFSREDGPVPGKEYLAIYEVKTGREKIRLKGRFENTGIFSPDSKTYYIRDPGMITRWKLQNAETWKRSKLTPR